jgi:hypothetical protein
MAEARFQTWWDPASKDAVRAVKKAGKGSPEVLMKELGVGYCRAAFLLGILHRMGVLRSSSARHETYKLNKKRVRSS